MAFAFAASKHVRTFIAIITGRTRGNPRYRLARMNASAAAIAHCDCMPDTKHKQAHHDCPFTYCRLADIDAHRDV
jgi:hypothetical protein